MNAQAGATRRPDDIHSIDIKGQRLRVAVRPGNGSGIPLLLVNGIGVSLEVFQPFIDELDPGTEVIRFDVPGTGGSPRSAMPYRFSTLASWITQILDQFGYPHVDVLGISWGGGLAQQFAFQYRQRCRRLILVSTGDATALSEPHLRTAGVSLSNDGRHGLDESAMAQVLTAAHLILAGDDDPIVPAINVKIMHRLIPRAKLHIYQGGHVGLLTHARELTTHIEEFLSAQMGNDRGRNF